MAKKNQANVFEKDVVLTNPAASEVVSSEEPRGESEESCPDEEFRDAPLIVRKCLMEDFKLRLGEEGLAKRHL